jgi:transposase
MPTERTTMRIIKEILRLKFEAKLSLRQIARSLKVGLGTVSLYVNRALEAGLSWPLPKDMDDKRLEQVLFPNRQTSGQSSYVEPDYAAMHQELKHKGVTKQLLWEDYKHLHGENGYQYSQFCQRYRDWVGMQQRSMRQVHKAGEKLFVDYCGPTVPIVNPDTGEIREAQIFVATWGASNYTFAKASWTQNKVDWIDAHVSAFGFFGGVPDVIVPDQLKSAVTQHCRYEPQINNSYQHMASHYKAVIIPARPYKPKDKAKVENAVLVVERWILARLRHQTFFTLTELNQHIRFLLDDLNRRPFKKLPGCRLSQFEALDKPAMRSLPAVRYQYTEFKLVRVNIDYHIEFDKHFYSVPHHLVKHQLEVQASRDGVALFFKGKQVARHARSSRQGGYSTDKAHMPKAHRKQEEWSPGRLKNWAKDIGPNVLQLTQLMLERKAHPEQAYRACLGLLSLSKTYDAKRLDNACQRAVTIGSANLRSVKSILQRGLDQLPLPLEAQGNDNGKTKTIANDHGNIRGPEYYH